VNEQTQQTDPALEAPLELADHGHHVHLVSEATARCLAEPSCPTDYA
jgi:hypothetical protein